jgi:hypothetical protein
VISQITHFRSKRRLYQISQSHSSNEGRKSCVLASLLRRLCSYISCAPWLYFSHRTSSDQIFMLEFQIKLHTLSMILSLNSRELLTSVFTEMRFHSASQVVLGWNAEVGEGWAMSRIPVNGFQERVSRRSMWHVIF